jgi:diketogulonate reductase-like aldo/keto reductase
VKPFGWTGIRVPVIGQGTWMMEAEARGEEALRLGLDLGLRHIDTAEMYGSGRAEQVVGRAIVGRRDEVFLVSKVLPENASYDGTLRACERSLRRLGVEQVDLYLLHWPSSHPIAETMRALEKLVAQGMTRYIGVSNFDVPKLVAAQQALRHERLACNQVLYFLGDRGIERQLLPYCAAQQIAVVAYSPFGSTVNPFPAPASPGGRVLASIAARHGATPRQVVLNFLTRHAQVFTIPKAARPEHVRDNAASRAWQLEPEEIAEIDRAFPAPDHAAPLGMI